MKVGKYIRYIKGLLFKSWYARCSFASGIQFCLFGEMLPTI